MSISKIASNLEVSKASASNWCRDIELSKEQKEALNKIKHRGSYIGRMKGAEVNRQKKLSSIKKSQEEAEKELSTVSKKELLILGVGLFWGEGSKSGSRFVFINSDPTMVRVMYIILLRVVGISKDRFSATVQINEIHRPRIDIVLNFWSSLLNLPLSQFGRPYFVKVKPKKKYENHDNYYGILRLKVRRGAELQYKMLAYIDVLKNKLPG